MFMAGLLLPLYPLYLTLDSHELISSLKEVGFVVACQLIYPTGNFTRFDNWRSFSSYCGTAPFVHESGTSIKRRKQCHYLGDRKMK
jgi:transposase